MQNLGTIDNTYTIQTLKADKGFYCVFAAIHNQTQNPQLIEVYKNALPAKQINIMNNLNALNHPNIIHLISQGNGPIVLNNHPQVNKLYIVYENITHSDLFDYISVQTFTERHAKVIFKKILEGVRAMHNANICHRDLKPGNILLDDNYNPKITGICLSCINMNNLQVYSGTKTYWAPEVLERKLYDGIKADIFSLGQLLINLVTGKFGFGSPSKTDRYYRLIIAQNFDNYWHEVQPNNLILSQEFKYLFIRMVDPNPDNRPSIDEILNSPWMQEINNLNQAQMNALENQVRNEFQLREQPVQQLQQNQHNNINNIDLNDQM